MEASEARQLVDISIFKKLNYTSARKLKHKCTYKKKKKKKRGRGKRLFLRSEGSLK